STTASAPHSPGCTVRSRSPPSSHGSPASASTANPSGEAASHSANSNTSLSPGTDRANGRPTIRQRRAARLTPRRRDVGSRFVPPLPCATERSSSMTQAAHIIHFTAQPDTAEELIAVFARALPHILEDTTTVSWFVGRSEDDPTTFVLAH